jgi:4-phosphopantoate--beta-alanine ligase
LIAHGIGEAFDYLIGEKTTQEAARSIEVASAMLLLARSPVISVNGNVAALSAEDINRLSRELNCKVEVNIFHRSEERINSIVGHLEENGVLEVLGREPDMRIPGLDHARAMCCSRGIFNSDVVLVPLEDGDRCKALVDMGKKVITIDLNPMSRTSRTATVTIVDNLLRALPLIKERVHEMKGMTEKELKMIIDDHDNESSIQITMDRIAKRY